MKSSKRTIASIAALATSVAALFAMSFNVRAPFANVAHADPTGVKYTGASSCEATQCHGAPKVAPTYPGDCSHNENTVYFKYDLHAKSFLSKDGKKGLNNDLSKKIAKNLGIKNAAEDQRCLICHALSGFSNAEAKSRIKLDFMQDIEPKALAERKFSVKQGVNCDGCHGPSAKYLEPHVTKGWTQAQRNSLGSEKLFDTMGLFDTKNLKLRANSCVSCHLKIDADLIKADHPELPFELDKFCHGEWMHWRPSGDYYGAKAWAMGQFASVREAALQLAERLKGADKVDQGLKLDSYRQVVAHLLMARQAAGVIAPDAATELTAQLKAVNDNWADAAKTSEFLHAMGKTADALTDKLNPMKLDMAGVEKMLAGVASEGAVASARGYRSSQQLWYALTALNETLFLKGAAPDADPKALNAKMQGDPKAQKIAELEDMAKDPDAFKVAGFLAKVQPLMPMFPGGKSMPLPGNSPDSGAGAPVAVETPTPPTPPVKPEVPVVVKPETPVAVKPETPTNPPPVNPPPVVPPVANTDNTAKLPVIGNPPPQPPLTGKQYCPECGRPFPFQYKYCPVDGTKMPRIVDEKKPE